MHGRAWGRVSSGSVGRNSRAVTCFLVLVVAAGRAVSAAAGDPTPPNLGITRDAAGPGGRAVLAWTPQASHRYRVEQALDPVGAAWQAAAELTADALGGALRWTNAPAAGAPARQFFRVADLGIPAGMLTFDSAARASDLVPVELSDLYSRSAQDTSDAIQVATAYAPAGSAPSTHGTVRLTGNAANPVQYDALPADHLVLVPLQGASVEVYVQQLDLTHNIYQWRYVSGGRDLVFRSEPAASGTRITVKGRYVALATGFDGVVFDVDLAGVVTGFNEVDTSGAHNLSDMTVTGTVAARDYLQTVQVRNRFELVSARNAAGRLEAASTSEQWNNNTVVFAGDTYRWNNVKRQRSFRDGKESDLDTYWNATGTLTRNGQPYGQYRKIMTAVGTSAIDLRFQVVLPDRVVDVEQWTVQVPGN